VSYKSFEYVISTRKIDPPPFFLFLGLTCFDLSCKLITLIDFVISTIFSRKKIFRIFNSKIKIYVYISGIFISGKIVRCFYKKGTQAFRPHELTVLTLSDAGEMPAFLTK
jgi:hypothetical protein